MRSSIDRRPHPIAWAFAVAATWAVIAMSATQVCLAAPPGSVVKLEGSAGEGFVLTRNGEPFVIRGVGGTSAIPLLAACGGNCIRTWDAESALRPVDGTPLLDLAHKHGVAVTVGLWLGHERHGFRYDDAHVTKQRRDVEGAVRRLKDHPALLVWGLGNEMEGPSGAGDSAAVWREVDHLARLVKRIDPDHPVMTVVANVNRAKVAAIQTHAPEVDILGVNAYAGAAGIGAALRQHGWLKPYCITEYGPPGPWEVPKTDWQAPIEPSSREKAAIYNVVTTAIMADTKRSGGNAAAPRCLGGYAFLWGDKQEATATWFGMLLPSGEKTLTVDAVTEAWTGSWPANRAPVLKAHDVPFAGRRVAAGTEVAVGVTYKDPEGDRLTCDWEVVRESTDRREGGDAEARPEAVAGAVRTTGEEGRAIVTVPASAGAYRLFITVRDGQGSGCTDNWPFFVTP